MGPHPLFANHVSPSPHFSFIQFSLSKLVGDWFWNILKCWNLVCSLICYDAPFNSYNHCKWVTMFLRSSIFGLVNNIKKFHFCKFKNWFFFQGIFFLVLWVHNTKNYLDSLKERKIIFLTCKNEARWWIGKWQTRRWKGRRITKRRPWSLQQQDHHCDHRHHHNHPQVKNKKENQLMSKKTMDALNTQLTLLVAQCLLEVDARSSQKSHESLKENKVTWKP